MCLTFKEPILALILGSHSLNVTEIGIVFSIDTVTHAFTSMGLMLVKEERNGLKYGMIQFAGMLLFFISVMMQGPAPFLAE